MEQINFRGYKLNIVYRDKQLPIFIDPGVPENIEVVSGIVNEKQLFKSECKIIETTSQKELLKIYKEKMMGDENEK